MVGMDPRIDLVDRHRARAQELVGVEVPRAMAMADAADALARELVIEGTLGLDEQIKGGAFANVVRTAVRMATARAKPNESTDMIVERAVAVIVRAHTERMARFLGTRSSEFRQQGFTLLGEVQSLLREADTMSEAMSADAIAHDEVP